MNPITILSNTLSLTGEAKIESLNSIYNRVALLRSKNISRKFIKSNNDQSKTINTSNFETAIYYHEETEETANFPNNMVSTKRLTKLSNDDKESDNIETNFWPSENLNQHSRMLKLIKNKEGQNVPMSIPAGEGRRRLLSTSSAVNKINRTVSVRGDSESKRYITSNRAYLMSDYVKNEVNSIVSQEQEPTISKNKIKHQPNRQLSNNFNSSNPNNKATRTFKQIPSSLFAESINKKRPLTSTISREQQNQRSSSYRISEASKSKNKFENIRTLSKYHMGTSEKRIVTKNNGGGNSIEINEINEKEKNFIGNSNINGNNNNINNNTLSRKSLNNSQLSLIRGETRYNTYKQEINKFEKLYESLSQVLISIKLGLEEVERAVSSYSNFIQSNKLSFIDDFIEDREPRLQKLVKSTRLQETLSICYLFLEISQERIYDNESYLVNFIGHSLSNLLLVLRLYMIKERKQEFEMSEFESALAEMEKVSYGEELTSQSDILLRIQHNTEILTMIHKKLGRNNDKFESCIVKFLKVAEREKYSSSLSAHYIFEFLAMHIHELELVGLSPTLELAPKPYAAPSKKQYTLVVEPLGILEKDRTYRPYVIQFMKWASKNFDVILWTWEQTLQVESIYNDLSELITTKLYRHHCKVQDNIFVKDLSRLGRDLTKTLIVDFDKRIFSGYEGNGIECRWRGNKSDKSLLVLSQILEEMITSETSVQDTLIFYAEEIFNVRGY